MGWREALQAHAEPVAIDSAWRDNQTVSRYSDVGPVAKFLLDNESDDWKATKFAKARGQDIYKSIFDSDMQKAKKKPMTAEGIQKSVNRTMKK
jgi:hypothetical protein